MDKPRGNESDDTLAASKYPGNPTKIDGVLCDSRFYPLARKPMRRLGQSLVEGVVGSPNPGDALPGDLWSLNKFLVRNNATQIDKRYPVVAVGSNADPQIIARKIKGYNERFGEAVNDVIPFVRATMHGLSIGHLPRPSKGTYFPFTAFLEDSEDTSSKSVEVVVTFLDKGQLLAIDSTEPNYDRVQVDGSRYPLILKSIEDYEEGLGSYNLYWTKRGVLLDESRHPQVVHETQAALIKSLVNSDPRLSQLFKNWPEHSQAKVSGEDFADSILELLAEKGMVSQVPLPEGINLPKDLRSLITYDRAFVEQRESQNSTFIVTPTPATSTPRFMPQIVLEKEMAKDFGEYAFLSFGSHGTNLASEPPTATNRGCVCKIVAKEGPEENGANSRVAGVDQLIRNALGVEIGETVSISVARLPDWKVLDLLIGSRKFHLLRQQTADISVVEQSTCLMDSTTMKIIGAMDGDRVVLYGTPVAGTNAVPKVRVRVVSADDRVELRRSLAGGGLNSRYPSTDMSIGVYPDIPWIFMDADTSGRLNISGKKLQPVVARVSRASLMSRYIREIFLGLLIGVLGLTYDNSGGRSLENEGISTGLFFLIGLITYLVIRFKIANETGAPSITRLYLESLSLSSKRLGVRLRNLFQ
jgi:hypothetical protein